MIWNYIAVAIGGFAAGLVPAVWGYDRALARERLASRLWEKEARKYQEDSELLEAMKGVSRAVGSWDSRSAAKATDGR